MSPTTTPAVSDASVPVLRVEDLRVSFTTPDGVVRAVDGVAFELHEGEILGVVGESGSGKSVTSMSILGLVPSPPATITGTIAYRGENLLGAPRRRLRQIRGGDIAMIFQDPMTALDPTMRVGKQIAEAVLLHDESASKASAFARAVDLLGLMGVPQPAERAQQYPHQFSGGMRQRAMIAMAMANNPRVLIADEPTTALDVTIQAQVLDLLRKAQAETGAATIFITHDLGVVAELADRIVVMYAGRVMESGTVDEVFTVPSHPYTRRLLESLPSLTGDDEMVAIPGEPPNLLIPEPGCPFRDRCSIGRTRELCATVRPDLVEVAPGHRSACHFARELDELDGVATRTAGNEGEAVDA